jgi:hypothetical protein
LETDKFGKLANKLNQQGGAFSNLMNLVKTSTSSVVYPACKVEGKETFLKDLKPTIVTSYENFDETTFKNFKTSTTETQLLVVLLGDSKSTKEYKSKGIKKKEISKLSDLFMKRISSKVHKMTEGDYVGMLTSSPKETSTSQEEPTSAGARQILSIYQTDNETSASNETYWVNETMMVDENVLGGMLAMSVMLTIFILAFWAINNITVSPHLTDAINPDHSKKNQ